MRITENDFTDHPLTEAEQNRFWSKVQKTDTCWFWTGACMVNGYGLLRIRGKNILAHRMAFYMAKGVMPNGNDVCHTCDVRNCVNPQHLAEGTRQENLTEMHHKGRWLRDKQNPSNTYQKVSRICLNCGSTFIRTISIYSEEKEPLCNKTCRAAWDKQYASERFWIKVDRSDPNGCWNWQGYLYKNGYGCAGGMNIGKIRDRLAHRIAWRLVHGDIPEGMHILHACDNPPCVNPAHLSLGTRSDNMLDASQKGRTRAPKPSIKGELHPNSVLTNQQRQEIRERHAQGESYSMLMKAYGVSKRTIARMVKGI